ncbi:hypothetical protein AcV5_001938, partial [Taiwanofungus camphoratus]
NYQFFTRRSLAQSCVQTCFETFSSPVPLFPGKYPILKLVPGHHKISHSPIMLRSGNKQSKLSISHQKVTCSMHLL